MVRCRFGFCALALVLLVPAAITLAQASKGNIYGTVVDEQGGVLPGVSATLSGQGAPQTAFTDARGEFHFLNLSPGSYKVTASLQGFATVERDGVVVNVGQNTDLRIPMQISAVAASVTVSGEVPVIDNRQASNGDNYHL